MNSKAFIRFHLSKSLSHQSFIYLQNVSKCNVRYLILFMRFTSYSPLLLFVIAHLIISAKSKCVYSQGEDYMPYVYDGESFPINYTMQACKEYIGEDVCCNKYNAQLTGANLKQVDGVFSSASGGCDVCSINVKRLWCEYACSPRQADFLKVSKKYYEYDDPERPGEKILAQQANLTIEASTACAIYASCKRVPFVTSVSAMSSPAGFLNFQGHNAIDNARQYINVFFTYNKSEGLYFGKDQQFEKTKEVTSCNYKGTSLHSFEITESCKCNSCEQACDDSQGYRYSEASVLQGFSWPLVLGVYISVGIITGSLTYYRHRRDNLKQE